MIGGKTNCPFICYNFLGKKGTPVIEFILEGKEKRGEGTG